MEIFLKALIATAMVSTLAVYLGIITDAIICAIILLITIIVFNLDAQMAK